MSEMPHLRCVRFGHCDIAALETSTLCVGTRQLSVLATENMSAVEAGQMRAETT